MESSSKNVNISESVLKDEMKLHNGSGKNGACLIEDVAEIMCYSRSKSSFSNRKYSFPRDRVLILCKAWGIRLDYLCGNDSIRTDEDFYKHLDDSLRKSFIDCITLCELLGYEVHLFAKDVNDYGINELIEIDSRSENITDYVATLNFEIYKDGLKICSVPCFALSNTIKTILKSSHDILDLYLMEQQKQNNLEYLLNKAME